MFNVVEQRRGRTVIHKRGHLWSRLAVVRPQQFKEFDRRHESVTQYSCGRHYIGEVMVFCSALSKESSPTSNFYMCYLIVFVLHSNLMLIHPEN